MPISRLESVSLRELWPNEARDFTTWLAENLDFLGEALMTTTKNDALTCPRSVVSAFFWKTNRRRASCHSRQLPGSISSSLDPPRLNACSYQVCLGFSRSEFANHCLHQPLLPLEVLQYLGDDGAGTGIVIHRRIACHI
jgi:hypothetical protein